MILKIKSPNVHLLDLLHKNPDTDFGLYFKPLKNGNIVGNAVNGNYYEAVFQDEKYSYLPEESNQIDFQSYCNPLVVIHICNELFGHILKQKEEYQAKEISWIGKTQGGIDTEECVIEIPTFYILSGWYKNGNFLLSKYFSGIELEPVTGKNFKLTITGKSVFEAFNLLSLVSLFTHITNEYGMFTYIDDSFASKYARILTNLENVPYFVFYLFIKRAVKSDKQFNEIKPIFEKYFPDSGITANLTYYDTHRERVRFISQQLDLEQPILDIGCGEFIYYKRMMNLGFSSSYFAVDEDDKFRNMSSLMAQKYDSDNLFFYNSLDDYTGTERVNILLTEVIEHNPMEEAKALIIKALTYNFDKLFITTPNVEFNQFYFEENTMRHDDHDFELTQSEFKELIENCILEFDDVHRFKAEYHYLGDSLNGIQPTQACVISTINRL